ncbi:MAG: serine dehydratase subunit alpha family protein, partial [Oscillospiraceae bacterium]|nr:serine dehydratase subunit alpha family protein [Oscillospiraceae bacterium]
MDARVYQEYVASLREELVPAMGCTEPIAVAYAAALAGETLGVRPDAVEIRASANIIKNVKSVVVPGTGGLRGIAAAAAAGIVAAAPELELQVLSAIAPERVPEIAAYLERGTFTVGRAENGYLFDICVTVTGGGHRAFVE